MTEDQISEEPIVLDLGSASGFLTQQEIEDNWDALFPECEDEPRVTLRDVNSASVDLHLGSECFVYSAEPRHLTEEDPYVTIPNGEFALLTTWETVHVPLNTLGLITLRHRYKKQGLVNISGFHLDPGFRGLVHYSVHNVGPSDLRLRRKDRMFTVFFATLTREAPRYDGDHQGQKGLSPQDLAGQPVNLVQR